MKIAKTLKLINLKFLIVILFAAAITGCGFTRDSWELEKAQKAESQKKYDQAIQFYYKYLRKNKDNQKSIKAAQNIFRIASVHTNQNNLIEKSLEHIILRSDDAKDRMKAQLELANHYFSRKREYETAINHYNRYLGLTKQTEDKISAKLNIAKAYFYLNNFFQSKTELEELLSFDPADEIQFDAKILLASVLQTEKKLSEAIGVYESVIAEFPSRAEKDQIYMNLALVLEDNKDFDEAVELLEKFEQKHSNPLYIREKIKKIKFLISQQPGARGRVK